MSIAAGGHPEYSLPIGMFPTLPDAERRASAAPPFISGGHSSPSSPFRKSKLITAPVTLSERREPKGACIHIEVFGIE